MMEGTPSDDYRWQELMSIQGERDNLVVLPQLVNRDQTPREASPRTVRFAEALAFDDAWQRITEVKSNYRRAA
jgi:hypothetical protein